MFIEFKDKTGCTRAIRKSSIIEIKIKESLSYDQFYIKISTENCSYPLSMETGQEAAEKKFKEVIRDIESVSTRTDYHFYDAIW